MKLLTFLRVGAGGIIRESKTLEDTPKNFKSLEILFTEACKSFGLSDEVIDRNTKFSATTSEGSAFLFGSVLN
ncbi:hypothetical protein HN499_05895 [archaeon]|jgi:hypothetical protein|nr:hypothetical protein [archaeon]